jgi:hypothetical protein
MTAWFDQLIDNEIAVCMEIIMSRLLYASALSRSAAGWISELRNARNQNQLARAKTLSKNVSDIYMNAAIRLKKLEASQALIYVRSFNLA